jgi:hypothetical protein
MDVNNYTDIQLERFDDNNCMVNAISNGFNIPYRKAYTFCEDLFKRQYGRGVPVSNSTFIFNIMEIGGLTLNKLKVEKVSVVKDSIDNYRTFTGHHITVNQFIKKHPKGTFLVSVKGHIFCIKDGVIYGNYSDRKCLRRKVLRAVEIKKGYKFKRNAIKLRNIIADIRYFGFNINIDKSYCYRTFILEYDNEKKKWFSDKCLGKQGEYYSVNYFYFLFGKFEADKFSELKNIIDQKLNYS